MLPANPRQRTLCLANAEVSRAAERHQDTQETHFHDPGNGNVIILTIITVLVILSLLPRLRGTVGTSFPLESWLGLVDIFRASATPGYLSGFEVFVYHIALDFVFAFDTGGGCEGTVALYQLLWEDPSVTFEIVDVLGEIGQ